MKCLPFLLNQVLRASLKLLPRLSKSRTENLLWLHGRIHSPLIELLCFVQIWRHICLAVCSRWEPEKHLTNKMIWGSQWGRRRWQGGGGSKKKNDWQSISCKKGVINLPRIQYYKKSGGDGSHQPVLSGDGSNNRNISVAAHRKQTISSYFRWSLGRSHDWW